LVKINLRKIDYFFTLLLNKRIIFRTKKLILDYSKYTEAICRGDQEVFRDYMDQTIDSIYKMVCRIVAAEDEARDIVQETYIKVWEKRNTLRSEKSILSWTRKIAVNKCYDYLRARKRRGEWSRMGDVSELRNLVSDFNAEDRINCDEYNLILKTLTSELSTRQQMVYTLSEIEKLSPDEIASSTGMSKSSIKSNLYHARQAIRKKAERIL